MSIEQPESFPAIKMSTSEGAAVTITTHGAHVISWITPDGCERLFLSARSAMIPGCAIRGGVPVCFPQFSRQGPLRPHGFVRNLPWQHVGTQTGEDSSATAHFTLSDSEATRQEWDHAFTLDLRVTIGGPQLVLALDVTNPGEQPFAFNAALHTYFSVSEISAVTVDGLGGLDYRQFGQDSRQDEAALRIMGEVDRIYWNIPGPIRLNDAGRALEITQEGFHDAVVWNPGPERAAALTDMEPEGYRRMLCIEAAQIGQPVTLAPGERWHGVQQITARA